MYLSTLIHQTLTTIEESFEDFWSRNQSLRKTSCFSKKQSGGSSQ